MVIESDSLPSRAVSTDSGQGNIDQARRATWSGTDLLVHIPKAAKDQHQGTLTVTNPYDGCVTVKPHHMTEHERNWRPNTGDRSQTDKWREKAREQEQKPLTKDAQGNYHAQPGDTMEGIARRSLREGGNAHPAYKDILKEEKRIAGINEDRYPSLRDKPDLLPPNAILRLQPGADDKACRADHLPHAGTTGTVDGSGTAKPGDPAPHEVGEARHPGGRGGTDEPLGTTKPGEVPEPQGRQAPGVGAPGRADEAKDGKGKGGAAGDKGGDPHSAKKDGGVCVISRMPTLPQIVNYGVLPDSGMIGHDGKGQQPLGDNMPVLTPDKCKPGEVQVTAV